MFTPAAYQHLKCSREHRKLSEKRPVELFLTLISAARFRSLSIIGRSIMQRFVLFLAVPAMAMMATVPTIAETLPQAGKPSAPPIAVGEAIGAMSGLPRCQQGCMTPVEAVTYASYVAPKGGIAGEFAFEIQAVGEQNGRLYLNSEKDYRDRNNLTIAMPRLVGQWLAGKNDLAAIQKALVGHRIVVRGVAQRVQIDLIDQSGKRTDKYYYQIHVTVSDPHQIALDGRG